MFAPSVYCVEYLARVRAMSGNVLYVKSVFARLRIRGNLLLAPLVNIVVVKQEAVEFLIGVAVYAENTCKRRDSYVSKRGDA